MSWSSDEFHHRSAEQSGWCAELRAADPEDVDESVPGAVEYAAETSPDPDGSTHAPGGETRAVDRTRKAVPGSIDPGPPEDEPTVSTEEPTDRRCSFCAGEIAEGEAIDGSGVPFPADADFEWAGDTPLYHRECIPEGEGRFLPWTANGVLGDEAAE